MAAFDWLGGRKNGVTALRLALALTVLVSHAYGFVGAEPTIGAQTLGTLAVVGFFGLSGYLLAASYARSRSPLTYLTSRALRILPGHYLALVVSALVAAPLLVALTHASWAGLFVGADSIPAFLWQNGVVHAPVGYEVQTVASQPQGLLQFGLNSPQWTLGHEVACYLILLALLLLCRRRTVAGCASVALMLVLLATCTLDPISNWLYAGTPLDFLQLYDARVALFAAAFFASASLYLWHVPLRGDLAALLGAGLVMMALIGVSQSQSPLWAIGLALALPYALLTLAKGTPCLALRTDLSYGVYLLGWPVQAVCATLHTGLVGTLGLALVVTMLLAYLSWHLIEAPALFLRDPLTRIITQAVTGWGRALPVPRSRAGAAAVTRTHPVERPVPSPD